MLAFPFPIGAIQKTEWLGDRLNRPLEVVVSWFARNALGLAEPSLVETGSRDRTWLLAALHRVRGRINEAPFIW